MRRSPTADIIREYGPFPGVERGGRRHLRRRTRLVRRRRQAATPSIPRAARRCAALDVAAHAGTAFDGRHLYQIAEDRIQKIDPATGRVLATIPAPGRRRRFRARLGRGHALGRAVSRAQDPPGRSRDRRDPAHHRVEPLRHRRDLGRRRAVARHLGRRRERAAPHRSRNRRGAGASRHAAGTGVSGLESDGGDRFFCGGGKSGKVRAVRRPSRRAKAR